MKRIQLLSLLSLIGLISCLNPEKESEKLILNEIIQPTQIEVNVWIKMKDMQLGRERERQIIINDLFTL